MRGGELADAAARVAPPDARARAEAAARQGRLTKPPGALGLLERIGEQLAGIAGRCPPPVVARPVVAVFAGDHGVLAEGVSPWPQEVSAQMVANFLAGGAAINVLARQVGAAVVVVDAGLASPVPGIAAHGEPARRVEPGGASFVGARVRAGTGNIAREPAMSRDEARDALDLGTRLAAELVAEGADCLVTGDMGIGNTTPSAALIAAVTARPPAEVTGRGTGISDELFARKVRVVGEALARARRSLGAPLEHVPPLELLAELGGVEIAAIAGLVVGGAAQRVPVVLDGVISLAGALVATALVPGARDYLVAGHRSVEPGASVALTHLALEPLLDLGLRLGEGTGGVLALPLVQAAARVLGEMATFEDAAVATPEAPTG
jgi:nicotinate-nucleotide--dimethylbenzimidazole phosphoribosyltransferase